MANGPLVRFARWRLGLKIVGRRRYAHPCGGCGMLVRLEDWRGHRCPK